MKSVTRRAFRRFRTQTTQLAIAQIDPMNFALLTFGVKRVVVGRVKQNIKAVAASKRSPVRVADRFLTLHAARTNPVFIALQTSGDAEIGFRIVQTNPVKFAAGKFIQMVPIFSAAEALIKAAIRSSQPTHTQNRAG